jgi:hypothetical protein
MTFTAGGSHTVRPPELGLTWFVSQRPRSSRQQWAKGGGGVRFARIVHHTDAEREWAYDCKSSVGKLDKALDAAQAEGWTVVDMKNDCNKVFPFGNRSGALFARSLMQHRPIAITNSHALIWLAS